jgi:hypothetical protein
MAKLTLWDRPCLPGIATKLDNLQGKAMTRREESEALSAYVIVDATPTTVARDHWERTI